VSEPRRPPVVVPDNHGFVISLSAEERSLLRSVAQQLREVLRAIGETSVPVPDELRRLLPEAYPTDVDAQRAFDEGQRMQTVDHHARSLEILEQTAEADHLSADEAASWLDALVELRLVYGTALGVEETWDEPDPDDSRFAEWVAYGYLTYLASELVDVLSPLLPPDDGTDDDLVPADPWGEPPGDLRWDGTIAPRDEAE
jgi:hypothetical protein